MLIGRSNHDSGESNKEFMPEGTGTQHESAYGNGRTTISHVAGEPLNLTTWLRLHGVDLITMALVGMIGLGVYFACGCLYFPMD
jgi:hypothetical protein